MVANRERQDQNPNVSKENDAQNYGHIIERQNPKSDTVSTSSYKGNHTRSHSNQMEVGMTRGQNIRWQMDILSDHVGPSYKMDTWRQIYV